MDKFIENLPDDPVSALLIIADEGLSYIRQREEMKGKFPNQEAYLDQLISRHALLTAFVSANESLSIKVPSIKLDIKNPNYYSRNLQNVFMEASQFATRELDKTAHREISEKFKDYSKQYRALLGKEFSYGFSDKEVERIQSLINELRDFITASGKFSQDHKRRLLTRLEKLQLEVHKRLSDLDKFWGLIGDAGVAIGKFGEDAKPFVDRIKELTGIVWRAQAKSEGISEPTEMPLLVENSRSENQKAND